MDGGRHLEETSLSYGKPVQRLLQIELQPLNVTSDCMTSTLRFFNKKTQFIPVVSHIRLVLSLYFVNTSAPSIYLRPSGGQSAECGMQLRPFKQRLSTRFHMF